jgi:hypothetical protein
MSEKTLTTTDENTKTRKKIEDALMGFLFGLCQPDKGDVFGFIDDFKSEISSHILQALEEKP